MRRSQRELPRLPYERQPTRGTQAEPTRAFGNGGRLEQFYDGLSPRGAVRLAPLHVGCLLQEQSAPAARQGPSDRGDLDRCTYPPGPEGLLFGLRLIHGLLVRFWDTLHPAIEADDAAEAVPMVARDPGHGQRLRPRADHCTGSSRVHRGA
jgi:hypothetical protein